MVRLIIAAVLGGIAMFMWSFFTHMVLGVGEAGALKPDGEAAVIQSLKANVTAPGFYVLPGMDMTKNLSQEEMDAWSAKYKEGPTAILVYNPTGSEAMTAGQLLTELGTNIAAALLVAIILSFAGVGFFRGVVISTLVGLAGWMAIEPSYVTWFRFPLSFIVGELIDQGGGFLAMGLVLGLIVRKRT